MEGKFFADEIRDPAEVLKNLPGKIHARPQELQLATRLIDSLTGPWQPDDYRDTYTDRVHDLIEAKRAGAQIVTAQEAPEPTNVMDLMVVLRQSVEDAGARRRTQWSYRERAEGCSADT